VRCSKQQLLGTMVLSKQVCLQHSAELEEGGTFRIREGGIYLRPSDIGCQYSRSIYTVCFIVWQPRHAANTSTNWRQCLFCCCPASMEQATDGAETAAIDRLVSSWSENIFVSFCLWAPRYWLTLWCALSLLVGGHNTSASVTVTLTVRLVQRCGLEMAHVYNC